jgi:hypothetical protein
MAAAVDARESGLWQRPTAKPPARPRVQIWWRLVNMNLPRRNTSQRSGPVRRAAEPPGTTRRLCFAILHGRKRAPCSRRFKVVFNPDAVSALTRRDRMPAMDRAGC